MFEVLSLNRAAISAFIIIVLALALVGSIVFELRDWRGGAAVFGNPLHVAADVVMLACCTAVRHYFSRAQRAPLPAIGQRNH